MVTGPLAWELPYATGAALGGKKKKGKKKQKKKTQNFGSFPADVSPLVLELRTGTYIWKAPQVILWWLPKFGNP